MYLLAIGEVIDCVLYRRVARVVGVDKEDVEFYMVRPVSRALEAIHARFAAACAIADLIECGDVYRVAEKYGEPQTASHSGIAVGQLQNLLADVAKWAGMGVSVCQAAGVFKIYRSSVL